MNRKQHAAFLMPDQLMLRQRARQGTRSSSAAPMRYARPGERPPSTRPPGTGDNVIDRLDQFASRMKQSGGRIN